MINLSWRWHEQLDLASSVLGHTMIAIFWWYLIFPIIWIWAATGLFRLVRQGTLARKAIVFLSLTLWYPAMFADDILGYWQWRTLCEKEAVIKVYKTVQLSPDQFDQSGMPREKKVIGSPDVMALIADRYERRFEVKSKYSKIGAGVDRYRHFVVDHSTKETMGEGITFARYRGGPPRPVPDMYGESCPGHAGDSDEQLLQGIFKPKGNK